MAVDDSNVKTSLDGTRQQFQQQIDFFRQKLNLPTERWDDIRAAAHDRAFMVAGAQKADLLNDLRKAVDKSVNGQSIGEFRKDFAATVAKSGWSGWTGEGTKAGEAWRTRVIYQTNVATSYAAGRWQQLNDPQLKAVRPFWKYIHADGVIHPRPLHKAWGDAGLTLPSDHPLWRTHFPPNGWGCGCRVKAVRLPRGSDATRPPEGWDTMDEKTGAPLGIDKGWGYAPGASLTQGTERMVIEKATKLPTSLRTALLNDIQQALLKPALTAPKSLDDFIQAGRAITDSLLPVNSPESALKHHAALLELLKKEVGMSTASKVASAGGGAKLVREASQHYPDSWTQKADELGPLFARASAQARGYHYTEKVNSAVRLPGFGTVRNVQPGTGWIEIRTGSLGNAIHEFAHRLQTALPELDALFQDLHRRRTLGAPLERLKDLEPTLGYASGEVTRKDGYRNPYQGKEYAHVPSKPALEVMTMAFEDVLGLAEPTKKRIAAFEDVYKKDREMFDFVVGLLRWWKP